MGEFQRQLEDDYRREANQDLMDKWRVTVTAPSGKTEDLAIEAPDATEAKLAAMCLRPDSIHVAEPVQIG